MKKKRLISAILSVSLLLQLWPITANAGSGNETGNKAKRTG
jgi:hypothetical protein